MNVIPPRALNPGRQRGLAALTVALIIVVVASIVTIGVTQIGVGEQKNMANEVRNKQAGSVADMSIDRAAFYLRQNLRQVRSTSAGGWMQPGSVKWVVCNPGTITPPCGDGTKNVFDADWTAYANVPNVSLPGENLMGSFVTHFVARSAAPGSSVPGASTFYVVAEGQSEDQTGQSLIKRAYTIRPIISRAPDAPLIAAGNTLVKGTFSAVANPNGGGPGVPLTIWSKEATDLEEATSQTCHVSEYLSTRPEDGVDTDASGYSLVRCPDCFCPNNSGTDTDLQLSNKDREGFDILDKDGGEGVNPDSTNFPDDLFEYIFGVPESDYQSIKDQATIIADCSGLGPSSSGLYWVTGDCSLPVGGGAVIGSLEAPVALVVEDGGIKMNGGGEFLGLIFLFARSGGIIDVDIVGGPTLYGALVSTKNIDSGSGSYTARYEKQVLLNLANVASTLTDVPGSWKDYR